MVNIKSERNKTIDTPISEGLNFLQRCIFVNNKINNIDEIVNKTINGDTFSVLNFIPHNSIDLLIVDPPYNISKTYASSRFLKKNNIEYENYTKKWMNLVFPLLKETSSIYVCCDWESSLIISNCLCEFFTIRNRITWQREKGRGSKSNWKNSLEDIWFATKSDIYTFNLDAVKIRKKVIAPYRVDGKPKDWKETKNGNYRDTCPSNFWDDITIPFWSMPENTSHPTQKSEKLIAKIILASSNIGDIILDPFLGSGTTSVTAKKLKRRYIGIEKEEQYCVWAEQRLYMANNENKIQGFIDGVFWDRNTLTEQLNTKYTNSSLLDYIK